MAAIFTPGLKVTEHTIVLKDRRLPMEGEVAVSVGQAVRADDVVARTELPGKVYPVNIANQLGVDPGQLAQHMTKQVGDRVEEGELVAATPGFLGLFKSEATAPVAGTIESISAITGQVIFQAHPIPVEIDAYITGKVVEVHAGEGCVVQAAGTLVQGIFGLGGEVKAELMLSVDSADAVVDAGDIRPEMAGRIVVGGSYATVAALKRAVEVGVAGMVVGGFDYDEIKELLGYEVGVAITGGEKLGLTLIVTEGFGRIPMAPATFSLLKSKVGRRASINGATQIRAGVIRPEVVVTDDDEDAGVERWVPPEPKGLSIGDQVRGIRAPFFGKLGRVLALPAEPAVLDTESKARIMEVEFEDGEVAIVPRANVEAIEREEAGA
ncbi:MAG: hypothetical protein H6742_03205 [Alphaproteobacteria bacterium]|nr:hypothetical protein [Alphaproteobacteria bacterium]